MARLIPDDVDDALADAIGHRGEWVTLMRLRDELPDEYAVYHHVHWVQATASGSTYGEIDFIIANRYGKLLAIEQKDGTVYIQDDDLRIDYPHSGTKSISTQITRNLNGLRHQFARRHPGHHLSVDHLLYCPNARVTPPLPISIDPARLVDADSADRLCEIITTLFDQAPVPDGTRPASATDVHEYLSDRVHAVPHIGLLGKTAREFTSRISGGLATWATRFTFSPYRLHITGTAGSGKTQLALQELRLAHRNGREALYICYNRPLADALKRNAPDPTKAVTIHEFGKELGLQAGQSFDFRDGQVFEQMIQSLHNLAPLVAGTFDTLVIDEAQDLDAAWIDSLLHVAKPDGRILVLEDPEQRLYDRQPFMVTDGWAQLQSPLNYRSPRRLVDFMNHLRLTDQPIEAGSGLMGFNPGWHYYDDDASLLDETEAALKQLLADGYDPANIALLTYHSSRESAFADPALRGLAGIPIKRPMGYDAQSNQIYSEGRLLLESVRRFKGQAADAVIITEVDFEAYDGQAKRLLFAALTRARLHAVLITSARARDALLATLN